MVAAAALAPALAACEAGAGAQTSRPYDPTDGASTVLHGIAIRNVFVLGPAPGQTLQAGQSAGMFLALVNNGAPDTLLDIAAPGSGTVKLPDSAVPLGMNQKALLTGPVPRVIVKLSRPVTAGQSIPVILYFRDAGTISMNVPVVARSSFYTTYSPPPSPAPTGTRTPRPTGTARINPGGRRSPGPTITPTTSPTP